MWDAVEGCRWCPWHPLVSRRAGALSYTSSCTCLASGMSIHGQTATATSASTGMRSSQVSQLVAGIGWTQGTPRDRGLGPGLELRGVATSPRRVRPPHFLSLWYSRVVLWLLLWASTLVPKEGHRPQLCVSLLSARQSSECEVGSVL